MPRRSIRATKHQPATMSESAAPKVVAFTGSPLANGAIATPAMRATVDSGPTESIRDWPITAYTMRAPSAVERPTSGGTPTMAE